MTLTDAQIRTLEAIARVIANPDVTVVLDWGDSPALRRAIRDWFDANVVLDVRVHAAQKDNQVTLIYTMTEQEKDER